MSDTNRLLMAGNWKMHGSIEAVKEFFAGLAPASAVPRVLVPPVAYLSTCQAEIRARGVDMALGVQDVHAEASGAFTGDTAAPMARELGAEWALVGHSERRQYYAETDEQVGRKLLAADAAGMTPIVCVGETLEQREAGLAQKTVAAQIATVSNVAGAALGRSVIAYEPVWAIGTGVNATPEQAEEMHAAIRSQLVELGLPAADMTILYGGSVKPDNAQTLFASENIDGALVGGASLASDSYNAIAQALVEAG